MSIRRNRFVECGTEAIRITPHNSKPNSAVHRNIDVSGNEFILGGEGRVLHACGTTGLSVTGNRICAATAVDPDAMIVTDGCADVLVENNTFSSIETTSETGT